MKEGENPEDQSHSKGLSWSKRTELVRKKWENDLVGQGFSSNESKRLVFLRTVYVNPNKYQP